MARKKDQLRDVKKFRDLLLYQITSGNMGTKPEKELKEDIATFGEMRGFLDSMIKIATLEKDDPDDEPSGIDLIKEKLRKETKENERKKSRGGRNIWGTKDPESDPDDGSTTEEDKSSGVES